MKYAVNASLFLTCKQSSKRTHCMKIDLVDAVAHLVETYVKRPEDATTIGEKVHRS